MNNNEFIIDKLEHYSFYLLILCTITEIANTLSWSRRIYKLKDKLNKDSKEKDKSFNNNFPKKYFIFSLVNILLLTSYYYKFLFLIQFGYSLMNYMIYQMYLHKYIITYIKVKKYFQILILIGSFLLSFIIFKTIQLIPFYQFVEIICLISTVIPIVFACEFKIVKSNIDKIDYIPISSIITGIINAFFWILYGIFSKFFIFSYFYLITFVVGIYYIIKWMELKKEQKKQKENKT